MYPVLFKIPLPAFSFALGPALMALALIAILLAVVGFRFRAPDLTALGVLGALAAVIAGLRSWSTRTALSPLPVYSYGTMLCLSLIIGWYLTLALARREGLPRERMAQCFVLTALSALIGARLLYVVTNRAEYTSFSEILALRQGGLVAYGGFCGGLLGAFGFLGRGRRLFLGFCDVAVPSVALGIAITRLGCYLFGCDFGKPLPESVPQWLKQLGTFPRWTADLVPQGAGSPAWLEQVDRGQISVGAVASLPVHPTQLYESFLGLLLFGCLMLLRVKPRFAGQLLLTFGLGYALLRFSLEALRGDTERGFFGPSLQTSHSVPLGLVTLGVGLVLGPLWSEVRGKKTRLLGIGLCFLPAVASWLVLRRVSFGQEPLQWSTSQWVALGTAALSAAVWPQFKARAPAA